MVFRKQFGIAEIGDLLQTEPAFDERERPARFLEVVTINALSSEALQLFGDRVHGRLGEVEHGHVAQIETTTALNGIDITGRKRFARCGGRLPRKRPPRPYPR